MTPPGGELRHLRAGDARVVPPPRRRPVQRGGQGRQVRHRRAGQRVDDGVAVLRVEARFSLN